ncbi:MAG: HlyD family secretion protein [Prevotella sp.]|jgi:hypothetical protein|nr:HlyD family secretion protein [Prevotella sp.]
MEKDNKSIELRSEKIRNIIGQVPSVLVRNGTLSICMVLIILLIISLFLPYREIISIKIRVKTVPDTFFFNATKNGFFVSDTILSKITSNTTIGYIIDYDTIQTIHSPISGDILMNVNSKEYVEKGKNIFWIVPHNYTYFGLAEITIEDIKKVKKGDKVSMKSYNNKIIEGAIENVYFIPKTQNFYEIKIRFNENPLKENLLPEVVYEGQIILSDISLLKKIMLSIGIK